MVYDTCHPLYSLYITVANLLEFGDPRYLSTTNGLPALAERRNGMSLRNSLTSGKVRYNTIPLRLDDRAKVHGRKTATTYSVGYVDTVKYRLASTSRHIFRRHPILALPQRVIISLN